VLRVLGSESPGAGKDYQKNLSEHLDRQVVIGEDDAVHADGRSLLAPRLAAPRHEKAVGVDGACGGERSDTAEEKQADRAEEDFADDQYRN
jgi:hypothetical protein